MPSFTALWGQEAGYYSMELPTIYLAICSRHSEADNGVLTKTSTSGAAQMRSHQLLPQRLGSNWSGTLQKATPRRAWLGVPWPRVCPALHAS